MSKRKVVVRGGGQNLYYVSDSNGSFYVKKGGGVWGSGKNIGEARSLEDALAIIKSHSGRDIERID